MAKPSPGNPRKGARPVRDDGPTHQMEIHPEFEDATDESALPSDAGRSGAMGDTAPGLPMPPLPGDTAPGTRLPQPSRPPAKAGLPQHTRVEPSPFARSDAKAPASRSRPSAESDSTGPMDQMPLADAKAEPTSPSSPPRKAAARDAARRVSSPSLPAAEAPPSRKGAKPTRDAVPATVQSVSTDIKDVRREVAAQETTIKPAPTAEERSSKRGVANQETTIRPAPTAEERSSRKGEVAHSATVLKPLSEVMRGDFPAPEDRPRKSGAVANASTVLRPLPEEFQEEVGEKPRKATAAAAAAQAPDGEEPDAEPHEAPARPKPLPFVDRRSKPSGPASDPGMPVADKRESRVFSTLARMRTLEGNQKWLAVVASGFGVLVLATVVYGLASGRDKPRDEELRRAYPYGYSGAKGPRGERAPGAAEVTFTFKMVAPCPQTAEPECLLYEYSSGRFVGRMLLRKGDEGWVRASDEGMPFLLAR